MLALLRCGDIAQLLLLSQADVYRVSCVLQLQALSFAELQERFPALLQDARAVLEEVTRSTRHSHHIHFHV